MYLFFFSVRIACLKHDISHRGIIACSRETARPRDLQAIARYRFRSCGTLRLGAECQRNSYHGTGELVHSTRHISQASVSNVCATSEAYITYYY